MLPLPRKHTLRCTECCACCGCHDFASPEPRARQHPSPLDSCQMLPLPRKHTLRCTECCACHDFGHGISARATTSQPFRQLPNAAPATQTHAQMYRMLRLPRLRQRHLQSAVPATISFPEPRARQHPSPLNSSQMLPL